MRLRMILLFATAVLALAGASTASAVTAPPLFGKITYSSGSTCAPGSCQLVAVDANTHPSATTGSLVHYNDFCGNSYPNGNLYVCHISFDYNAVITTETFSQGSPISVYAQQACPGGGFHFSAVHHYTFDVYAFWWGGTFQLGSGCQT